MVKVVAGVLERNGLILICRRRADQAHALKWEFPGGKVEPGETTTAALKRELQEELGILVGAAEEITSYRYKYPEKNEILLTFFRVGECHGEPRNLNFLEMRWERPEKLPEVDFVEGDRRFIDCWRTTRPNSTDCA